VPKAAGMVAVRSATNMGSGKNLTPPFPSPQEAVNRSPHNAFDMHVFHLYTYAGVDLIHDMAFVWLGGDF
jgi:hypothetical protein